MIVSALEFNRGFRTHSIHFYFYTLPSKHGDIDYFLKGNLTFRLPWSKNTAAVSLAGPFFSKLKILQHWTVGEAAHKLHVFILSSSLLQLVGICPAVF